MECATITVAVRQDRIGIITLNRPDKRNALSIRMRREIESILDEWRDHADVRLVILTGAGTVFSAGFALDEFKQPECHGEIFASSSSYHRTVWNFPKPVIAAINGAAMGGGFDLATLCDMRICSTTALFGHPEIKFGAPPLFTPLRWIVGHGAGRDLCLTGRRIDAAEALRIGLVSRVVEACDLMEHAVEYARQILESPQGALEFTKKCFIGNTGSSFEESFSMEHDLAFKEIILDLFTR